MRFFNTIAENVKRSPRQQAEPTPARRIAAGEAPVETAGTNDVSEQAPAGAADKEVGATHTPEAVWGRADDDLLKQGFTQQQIDAVKRYNPETDGNPFDFYSRHFKKPEEIDEKKLRKARIAASITDGLATVAQMIGGAAGGYVERIDPKQSALSQLTEKEEKARNRYTEQLEKYRQGLYQAGLQSFNHTNSLRESMRQALLQAGMRKQNREEIDEKYRILGPVKEY